jgi:hypothetical protein
LVPSGERRLKCNHTAINLSEYFNNFATSDNGGCMGDDAPPGIRGESLAGFGQNLRSPHNVSAVHQEPRTPEESR